MKHSLTTLLFLFLQQPHNISSQHLTERPPQRGLNYKLVHGLDKHNSHGGKITISSTMGCRGAGGAYTRAEGPREASVVEGTAQPEKTTTPNDCKFRRGVFTGDVGWSSMLKSV
jgi:hypothetical protein